MCRILIERIITCSEKHKDHLVMHKDCDGFPKGSELATMMRLDRFQYITEVPDVKSTRCSALNSQSATHLKRPIATVQHVDPLQCQSLYTAQGSPTPSPSEP